MFLPGFKFLLSKAVNDVGDDFHGVHAPDLTSVRVIECTGLEPGSGVYHLNEVELDVQAYQLRAFDGDNNQQADGSNEKSEELPQARIIHLPSKELDGVWESYATHIDPSSLTIIRVTNTIKFQAFVRDAHTF